MSNLLKLIPDPEPRSSRRMTIKGQLQTRPLSQANQEALLSLGNPSAPSSDPQGQCLRQMRLKQGKNPAELATQACISLAQLYGLESGAHNLFYTPDFALQAKRRVARLLGVDWDTIAARRGGGIQTANSNVRALLPVPAAVPAQRVKAVSTDDIAVPRLISVSADCEVETVKADEPVDATVPQASAPQKQVAQGPSSWWWILVLTLIAGAGTQWERLSQILATV